MVIYFEVKVTYGAGWLGKHNEVNNGVGNVEHGNGGVSLNAGDLSIIMFSAIGGRMGYGGDLLFR